MKKTLLTFIFAIAATFAMAQTKTYSDALNINMDGTDMAPQESTIIVTLESDGTYTLALKNFVIVDSEMEMPIGNIVVNGINATEANSIKTFSVEQEIVIQPGDTENDWLGPSLMELPIKLNGKMTNGSLYCNIDIDLGGNIIKVVFGQDIIKTFSYEENLVVSVGGVGMEPQRTTIYVDEVANSTYTLALNNFELPDMPIGNIVLKSIEATEENGVKSFAAQQAIVITPGDDNSKEWYGPGLGEMSINLNGKMTNYKLYCNIDLDFGEVINVTFGQADLSGIENIAGEKGEKVIFDLTGRRVEDFTAPGIYIVNGKKVLFTK